jgi:hypothetical protein
MISPHVQQMPPHVQHGPPPVVRPRSRVNNTSRCLDKLSVRCVVVDGCGLSGMESGHVQPPPIASTSAAARRRGPAVELRYGTSPAGTAAGGGDPDGAYAGVYRQGLEKFQTVRLACPISNLPGVPVLRPACGRRQVTHCQLTMIFCVDGILCVAGHASGWTTRLSARSRRTPRHGALPGDHGAATECGTARAQRGTALGGDRSCSAGDVPRHAC